MMNQNLTPREWEVAQYIAECYTGPEIARLLNVSIRTVDTHRKAIYDKLGIRNPHGIFLYVQWRRNFDPRIILQNYPDGLVFDTFVDADIWCQWEWKPPIAQAE